jgi:hypothetical protein
MTAGHLLIKNKCPGDGGFQRLEALTNSGGVGVNPTSTGVFGITPIE